MFGSSQDFIPGQILGTIGHINRCLRTIDPQATLVTIRKDYNHEIELQKKPLTELYNACKRGECGDYNELNKKSLILQELQRLVTIIVPQVMSPKVLDTVYQELKKQPDLWSSVYHEKLDELEKLIQSTSRPSLNRSFLNALNAQLKLFISKNGFFPADSELQHLFTLASSVQAMINNNNGTSFELVKTFINAHPHSLQELISKEEEQLFLSQFIQEVITTIECRPLQEKLLTRLPVLSMNKALLDELTKIATLDKQIHALSTVTLAEHQLSLAEIESVFPVNKDNSLDQTLEYTSNQAYLLLLSKAYPHSKDMLDTLRMKSTLETNQPLGTPELLHCLISAEVLSQIKGKDLLTQEATKQLLDALLKELNKPQTIQSNLTIIQLHLFLQGHIKRVEKEIEKRKLILDALGFASPTFKNVEQVMNEFAAKTSQDHSEITLNFYKAIKAAKEQFLCQKKPFEELKEKDVIQFFKSCCTAGKEAFKTLDNTRSLCTIIIDALKMLMNWAIRTLTCGKTPQFFKPQKTTLDNLASAVEDLKEVFEDTLTHLDLDLELEESITHTTLDLTH